MSKRLLLPLLFLLTVIAWVSATVPVWPDQIILDAEAQYGYAEKLADQGQFRRAAEEYDRFSHFFPGHPRQRLARFKSATAFFKAGDSDSALPRFNELAHGEILDHIAVESFFMMTECHLFRSEFGPAMLQMHNLISLSDDPLIRDRAFERMAWLHIDRLDWEGARAALGRMSAPARADSGMVRLDRSLQEAAALPRKSPALAGTLSVIPGMGQLYTGRYEDALLAFLVNGALAWAAYESFDHDLYALGGLLTFVELGFYASNVYGAASSAHKYNQRLKQGYADGLRREYLNGPSPGEPDRSSSGRRFGLAFRIPF